MSAVGSHKLQGTKMKFKLKNIVLGLLLILTSGLVITSTNQANAAENKPLFSIKPVMPDNQADSKSTFWNVVLNPGQKETLYVDVINSTDKELKLKTNVANASTNMNGQVQYTSPTSKGSSVNPEVDLTKNVQVAKDIVLKAKETKRVPVDIEMANKSFTGLASGGVAFFQDPSTIEKSKSDNKKSFGVENRFQYVATLVMRQHPGTTDLVKPTLTLDKVGAQIINGQTVIGSVYSNTQPGYLDNMFMTVDIKGKNNYDYSNMQMGMAPKTSFTLPIQTNGVTEDGTMMYQPLEAGTYKYHAVVYGRIDDNGQYQNIKTPDGKTRNYRYRWEFNKEFKITSSEANDLNKKNLFKPKEFNIWLWIAIGAGVLLLIALLAYLFSNRKKEVVVQNPETKKYLVQTDSNIAFSGDKASQATVYRNKKKAKQATKGFKNVSIIDYKDAMQKENNQA